MNVICVMLDSLRTDHVGAYGNKARTPNMDRFASESLVFDKAYSGSFPTLPCRRDLFTGRWGQPFNTWNEMERDIPSLAGVFRNAGYTTGLVFDTPMFMTQGNYLDRGFGSIEWVRGQGGEPWISDALHEVKQPASDDKVKPGVMRYLANQRDRLFESDYLAPRVFTESMHWLERNYVRDNFFLWIDSWDPHEPWDPPQYYVDMYDPGYEGEELIYPCYGFSNFMSEKELNHVRALYAAEVTMVDRWLGMLWDTIDLLGLKENTIVLVMADHGHYFGDHGLQGKPWGDWGQLYEPMIHIPFMMYHPEAKMAGQHIDSLVQPVDLFPTLCDLAGLNVPGGLQGNSFADILLGKTVQHREFAISGRNLDDNWGTVPTTVTDGTWTLVYWPNKDLKYKGPKPIRLERYDCRNMPERRVDELFYMPDDPGQEKNVIGAHPEEAKRLYLALLDLIAETGTDAEIAKTYQPEAGNQYQ
ncbi:MAG: sulfatase [Candidatus Latescibacteria bacterium]|nr:sulfatase [Candidatus Latescibacterota bacterium]